MTFFNDLSVLRVNWAQLGGLAQVSHAVMVRVSLGQESP